MPFIAFGLRRAIVWKLMPKAFKSGMTQGRFYNLMKGKGLGYAKSQLLHDWRTRFDIEIKKDALKYVRKDRLPSVQHMIEKPWNYDKEYIYKVQTWSRIHPDMPLEERFGTIQSDIPLTPAQVEEEAVIKWPSWEECKPGKLERVQAVAFFHIVPKTAEEE